MLDRNTPLEIIDTFTDLIRTTERAQANDEGIYGGSSGENEWSGRQNGERGEIVRSVYSRVIGHSGVKFKPLARSLASLNVVGEIILYILCSIIFNVDVNIG